MNETQPDDLDWLAFRYVAAELSPGESREFERRLEQDQEAREAVGRLVEVTCVVRALDWDAAPPVTPVRRLRPWYHRGGLQLAAGLALGLAFALLVFGPHPGDQTGRQNGSLASAVPPAELALVWSHARAVLTEQPEDEAAGWQWLAPADREPDAPLSSDDEAALDAPEWMVSAVVAMESEDEDQQAPDSNIEGI
ncbi:MAG: hypothetical protein MUE50_18310 [Pirellulaceae bacterium]|jgi:hypothetical protein|nr:hypothetical protein [Pirellulaceae bacterium]